MVSQGTAKLVCNILTTAITNIMVSKSADHTMPLLICFLSLTISTSKFANARTDQHVNQSWELRSYTQFESYLRNKPERVSLCRCFQLAIGRRLLNVPLLASHVGLDGEKIVIVRINVIKSLPSLNKLTGFALQA